MEADPLSRVALKGLYILRIESAGACPGINFGLDPWDCEIRQCDPFAPSYLHVRKHSALSCREGSKKTSIMMGIVLLQRVNPAIVNA